MRTEIGLAHFWEQGDIVSHTVAIILAFLSVASWSVIALRFVAQIRVNRSVDGALETFWSAPTLEEAVERMTRRDYSGILAGLARIGVEAARIHAQHEERGIGSGVSSSEFLTRAMRNYMVRSQARLESGLTFLASVGSTAPFIGLFGTVWGIFHALVGLSGATQVVLDKVAGPVGEALVMTAAGLFVAIPAVLAYNALNRANRLIGAYLDGFAHDLHAFLTTGARVAGGH
ncbi:MotA/TolQ/ExbB proton channel family protein [Paramagnetospirillum magnetotacticum MS-1]|uniref:Biopolymer transport protein ExbB n=1 Tax=Paramagnetospirillum magnetotacticum MS-1 TaxID=272627 RepID=A0A0C2YI66_PARME|nr:MotA/TolQ/ExbB proton channel family protein [Paramagnetospirillum magnetotacticum]KIL99439.1 MotA/TolQ/ExbB proton channel family protein [Paramagnetospirillum magnetotacticum MS-1]